MSDCLFCKILEGSIPSEKIFENDKVYGFRDLYPQAKTHLLFIHKEHSKNVIEMANNNPGQLDDVYRAIGEYADTVEFGKTGFRVVTNVGPNAGQTVFHTHFHVLGDEPLGRFGR